MFEEIRNIGAISRARAAAHFAQEVIDGLATLPCDEPHDEAPAAPADEVQLDRWANEGGFVF